MKTIDTEITSRYQGQKLKPVLALDMKLEGEHTLITDCDIPIKNLGKDVTGDSHFYCGESGDGLLGHWRLDEMEGTTAYDSIGNSDGTIYNSPEWIADYPKKLDNGSLFFQGIPKSIGQYINCGNHSSLRITGDKTLTAWVRLPQANYTGGNTNYYIVDYEVLQTRGFMWRISPETGKMVFRQNDSGISPYYWEATSNTNLLDGEWHFISIVYNSSTKTVIFYLDANTDGGGSGIEDNAVCTSGDYFTISKNGQPFYGNILDVRYYNKVLSATEIANRYKKPRSAWNVSGSGNICEYLDVPDFEDWKFDYDGWSAAWSVDSNNYLQFDEMSGQGSNWAWARTDPNIIERYKWYFFEFKVSDIVSGCQCEIWIGSPDGYLGVTSDGTYRIALYADHVNEEIWFGARYGSCTVEYCRIFPAIHFDGSTGGGQLINYGAAKQGELYKVNWTIENYVSGEYYVKIGAGWGTSRSADGSYTDYIYADNSVDLSDIVIYADDDSIEAEADITICSVKKVLWITQDYDKDELITDKIFKEGDASDSAWNWGASWSSPSDNLQADFSDVGSERNITQNNIIEIDAFHKLVIKIISGDSDMLMIGYAGYSANDGYGRIPRIELPGTYEYCIQGRGSSILYLQGAPSTGDFSIKRVSCKKYNVDDITEVYAHNPFTFTAISQSAKAAVDKVSFEISDIDGSLKSSFVGNEDIRGSEVVFSIVLLDKHHRPVGSGLNHRLVLFKGEIDEWDADEESIKITVTSPLYDWNKTTLRKHSPSCTWRIFGSGECQYSKIGNEKCGRAYSECAAYSQTDNFGGFRWLSSIVDKNIWWGDKPENET